MRLGTGKNMQVRFEDLHKSYQLSGSIEVRALRGVSANIEHGECVAVVGPSGAGKSTLLHMAGLMDRPSRGSIFLGGTDVTLYSEKAACDIRRKNIGFIFQMHYLLPEFTVLENVLVPVWHRRRELVKNANDLLQSLGLSGRLKHLPSELSGGEQQRVAMARALISGPSLVLADEPTGNLDRETGAMVEDILLAECKKRNATLIIVTHNAELASKAGRIISMRDGLIDN
jgi:lipoprotein-releasing system ATP-binding protein